MNKIRLKSLVKESYKDSVLDPTIVYAIADSLKRSELKEYIDKLKDYENRKNVIVTTPFDISNSEIFEELFPNKKIVFKKDTYLILGLKIVDYDNVYEFNLKNTLDDIISLFTKNYD